MTEPTELPAALPRLPPQHLPRPRLHQPLLRGECRLRLLCAPAGSGKTVLLGECARRAPPGVQVVWLALGGEALDPATFRRRLAGALGLPEDSDEAQLCRRLRNASALWLLLDDYPRHPDPALDACLDRLLSAASPRVGWWLASRRRPQCNLARLLLEGELLEVDGGLLAFDADEVAELLRLHGRSADAATAGTLLERSGGWCAALRLRLLVGEETAGPLLQEYLQHELLDELPPPLADAARALAWLPQVGPELFRRLFEELPHGLDDLLARGFPCWPMRTSATACHRRSARPGAKRRSARSGTSTGKPANGSPNTARPARRSTRRWPPTNRKPPPDCCRSSPRSNCCTATTSAWSWPCATNCRRRCWPARRAW